MTHRFKLIKITDGINIYYIGREANSDTLMAVIGIDRN